MRRLSILLLLLAGAGGWAALRSYRQQARLLQQIEELTQVLTTENDLASRNAQNTIKGIEAAVAKNRNQPTDRALLRHAEAIQTCVKQLVETLQTCGDQLRLATGNKEFMPLQHPNAAIGEAAAKSQQQALEKQLIAYIDTLRHSGAAEAAATPLLAPAFEATTPVADVLADLSRLESEILARQTHTLKRISERVGALRWPMHPVATATAESNVVAPGSNYRAQLEVVGYFSANELKMQMACNGQPVPISPNGTGLVRFRAPTRPGPATWTGTIRLNQHGRDTTFKVTVPYRVARR
jgi:hypothetical protein